MTLLFLEELLRNEIYDVLIFGHVLFASLGGLILKSKILLNISIDYDKVIMT
jgi:hypothetical protein